MNTLDWMMAAITVASTIISVGTIAINLQADRALRRAAGLRK